MEEYLLTTIDNPYDPFDQFDDWFRFDMDMGYNTCAYVDKIARTSDQLSDEENRIEMSRALDEIIKYDFMNIYVKVKEKK